MIPKTIHYCWFGRNPKPKLAEKCIASWKKYCKDYEIREWNEDNFDIKKAPLYVRQAYDAKKWAFVTDYVRLYAMVTFGGIYMDTDVEVRKPLDKLLLKHQAFSGFESDEYCVTGIMACQKNFPLFKEFLDEYNTIEFVQKDGSFDLTTNVIRMTNCCKKYGLVPNGKYQEIKGFAIYPSEYFCPLSYYTGKMHKTHHTYSIHWYLGSWLTEEQKEAAKCEMKRLKKENRNNTIHYITHTPNRILRRLLGDKRYEKLKKIK